MNGLLHRLAARATGSALTLRADARQANGASAPQPAEPLLSPGSRMSDAVLAPSHESFLPDDAHPSSFTARQAAQPRMTDAEADDAQKESKAPKPPTPASARLFAASQPGLTPGDVQAPAVASQPPHHTSLDVGLPAQDPAVLLPSQPSGAVPPVSKRLDPSALAQPSHPNHHAPAPLLPRQDNAPPSASAPWPAVSPAATPARIADDTAEVHIHIGRIEVTAVHGAAPPRKRTAAAAPASTPLDTYLAARQRERS